MPKSKYLGHKNVYDFISVKFWSKTAQISEKNFGNPQNLETFCYFSNFKFSAVVCNEILLKF